MRAPRRSGRARGTPSVNASVTDSDERVIITLSDEALREATKILLPDRTTGQDTISI
jgi:hypothetical protein